MYTTTKSFIYSLGFSMIILISMSAINADINDNEVGENAEYQMIQGVKVYQGDRECVMVGGLCVHIGDCNEPSTNRGLCPTYAHRGVECCYEPRKKFLIPPPYMNTLRSTKYFV